MSRVAYRWALHLLSKRRRQRYANEMADVFGVLEIETKRETGFLGLGVLWMKEAAGLARFAIRDRWARLRMSASPRSPRPPDRRFFTSLPEIGWAWRNVRARGARAALIVGLIGVALAANTLVFATADSLVFHRLLYHDPDRLVELQSSRQPGGPGSSMMSASLLDEWRKQADIFSGVHAYLTKTVFLTGDGMTDLVPTSDVTPGLIDMLGVKPRWGRSLVDSDAHETDTLPVLLGEELAARRFGNPALAVGRRIETSAQPLLVVGVMPADFRFPYSTTRLWRAMDPRGPLTANFAGVSSIARMAPGVSVDVLKTAMAQKSAAIGAAAGRAAGYAASPGPMQMAASAEDQRRLSLMLLGAALCLLLTACANVASLELANAVNRARTYAIQLSLGASRGTLARVAFIEGAWLVGAATLLALGLSWLGVTSLAALLPSRISFRTLNPIDLDGRAFLFMIVATGVTWILVSLPLVFYASRSSMVGLLKVEGREASASRGGAAMRRLLTVVEVAMAVMLLVGGLLYARTYQALIGIDKGFDSSNVVNIGAAMPPQALGQRRMLVDQMIERVKAMPGVLAAIDESPPPSFNTPWGDVKVEVDDRPPAAESIRLTHQPVDPAYFAVLKIPLKQGRLFERYEQETNVVITESFARRYWPNEDAVGHRFRPEPKRPWETVIGVVGDVHSDGDVPGRPSDSSWLLLFTPRQRPVAPKPMTPEQIRTMATGGMYGILGIMVRLDSMSRADAVLQAARTVDPRLRITLDSVDDSYAKAFSATLLATRVVSGFGVLAFVVAMAGTYGVMAFLVAGRTREIGIRMALGAERRDISRLVLGSSMRLVVLGAGLGIGGALAASEWIRSELFGVAPADPLTYGLVTASVIATAALATWQPARQAARVDPAITLRAE